MTTITTAEPQWIGPSYPRLTQPSPIYWAGVSGVCAALAIVLALTAVVWLLRPSHPRHALAMPAASGSLGVLIVSAASIALAALAVSLGPWWWLLISAWTVAAVAAAAVLVVDRRHRIRSDAKDSVAAGETRS